MGIAVALFKRILGYFDSSKPTHAQSTVKRAPALSAACAEKAFFRPVHPAKVTFQVRHETTGQQGPSNWLSVHQIELGETINVSLAHSYSETSHRMEFTDSGELRKRLYYLAFFSGRNKLLTNHHASYEKVRFLRFIKVKCRELTCTVFKMRDDGENTQATATFDGYLKYSDTGTLSTSLNAICDAMNRELENTSAASLVDSNNYLIKNTVRGIGADSANNFEPVIIIETVVEDLSHEDLLHLVNSPVEQDGSYFMEIATLAIFVDHADAYDYLIDPVCLAAVNEILLAPVICTHETAHASH